MASLLDGRNLAPLSSEHVKRAIATFWGLDSSINVIYEENSRTRFRVVPAHQGEEERGEIVFSNDLYPGQNIVNANSSLSMKAAAAHEIAHYYRWLDMRELHDAALKHIDEAQTSLEAAKRFGRKLSEIEVEELVADAQERLRRYVAEVGGQ